MKSTNALLTAALLLLPAIRAVAQAPAETAPNLVGIVVSSREAGFTVSLPAGFDRPETKSESSKVELGKVQTTTYSSGNDRGACLVSFSKFPEKLFKLSTGAEMLDNVRDGALGSTEGGQIDKQEDFSVDGNLARTVYFTGTSDGTEYYSRFDWVIASPFLYQIAFVAYSRDELEKPDILAYFNSFRMTVRKKGK
jgi:hypothetical protein